jgi:hypothetical protein
MGGNALWAAGATLRPEIMVFQESPRNSRNKPGCLRLSISAGILQLKASACIFLDRNNAFRTCSAPATSERFLAGRHIETVDGNVTFVIQRVEMLRDGVATGIADALRPLDSNFQFSHLDSPRFFWDRMDSQEPCSQYDSIELRLMSIWSSWPNRPQPGCVASVQLGALSVCSQPRSVVSASLWPKLKFKLASIAMVHAMD